MQTEAKKHWLCAVLWAELQRSHLLLAADRTVHVLQRPLCPSVSPQMS